MKPFVHLFLFFCLLHLTGCGNLFYLSKLGWHQSFVIFQSVPVQEVLEDENLEDRAKEKIRVIQEVKRYGVERLGLEKTGSYTTYFETKKPILFVITASQKNRLELHHWKFPIVGKVTYKSFFTEKEVLKEKRSLKKKDLDIYIQQVAAYSTLGWLKDPIFSSMLKWDEPILANIIIHEMVHGTLYFKGETGFNEQLATFIGNRGAIDFLTQKYGARSREVALAIHYQEDDLLFGEWIEEMCRQLSIYYDQPVLKEEKVQGREKVFQSIRESFGKVRDQLKTDCYKGFDQIDLNNAVLLAYRRYLGRLDRFDTLYESLGKDLKKVVDFFKEMEGSEKDPSSSIDQWMREGDSSQKGRRVR